MFSEVSGREIDVRFASDIHAFCSRHVDPPELLHLADSSTMHRRNEALVATMNTLTLFCNVNDVQKWVLNIMTAELSMNKIKICYNLSPFPREDVPSGQNSKTKMASRNWVNCLSLWHFCSNSVSFGQNSGTSCYNSDYSIHIPGWLLKWLNLITAHGSVRNEPGSVTWLATKYLKSHWKINHIVTTEYIIVA